MYTCGWLAHNALSAVAEYGNGDKGRVFSTTIARWESIVIALCRRALTRRQTRPFQRATRG